MKLFLYIPLIFLVSGCAAPRDNSFIRTSISDISLSSMQGLQIKTRLEEDVIFQGFYDYDDIDLKSGNMSYPADTGAMFLVSIFTHAVAANSVKNNAMSQAQARANTVLEPYRRHLQEFENEELVSSIINRLNKNYDFQITKHSAGKNKSDLILKSEPVFFMTQDQRELLLKHAMYVYRSAEPEVILHQNIVEISSRKIDVSDQLNYWIYENNLPLLSSELYAESIKLFLDDMLGNDGRKEKIRQKTFRYLQGGQKKYERGTLVKNECGQTTMRTLRGWIKSFPVYNDISDESKIECVSKSYVDQQVLVDFSKI